MNKDQFLRFLKEPASISSKELDEVEQVIAHYPYFQSARALIASGKKQLAPDSASGYIASAAVYVTDRSLLKKYINGQLLFLHDKEPELVTQSTPPSEKVKVAKKQEAKPEQKPAHLGKKEKAEEKPKSREVKEIVKDSPSTIELDELIKEVYQDLADLKQSKARFREWERKQEEEDAVNSAVEQAIDRQKKVVGSTEDMATVVEEKQEKTTDKHEDAADKGQQPDEPAEEASIAANKKVTKKAGSKSTAVKKESKPAKKRSTKASARPSSKKGKAAGKVSPGKTVKSTKSTSTGKKTASGKASTPKKTASGKKTSTKKSTSKGSKSKSSTDTAKTKSSGTASKSSSDKKSDGPSPKSESKSPDSKATTKSGSKTQKSSSSATSKKQDDNDEVISKRSRGDRKQEESSIKGIEDQQKIISEFIDKDPDITRPDKISPGDKEKSDLSEKSTRFHADIASEYLAEIYIEQGKYERAIEIYENLSLKFPEKKSFFASRIEQLKKK